MSRGRGGGARRERRRGGRRRTRSEGTLRRAAAEAPAPRTVHTDPGPAARYIWWISCPGTPSRWWETVPRTFGPGRCRWARQTVGPELVAALEDITRSA